MAQEMRSPIESGCPDGFQYMHPVMRKNYGQWAYHEDPQPGVLLHVANNGDKIWTVRAGTQRILDLFTLRKLCEIGDTYGEGYVRFTIRSNIEYMVSDEAKVEPLIKALTDAGFVVGGTQQLRRHDVAHPGLAALRHPGHRRLRRGQVDDGRADRRVQRLRTCRTACT